MVVVCLGKRGGEMKTELQRLFIKDKRKYSKLCYRYLDDFSWIIGYETACREIIKILKKSSNCRRKK